MAREWYDDLRDADVVAARGLDGPSPSGVLPCEPPDRARPPGIAPRAADIAHAGIVRAIQPPRIVKLASSTDFRINDNHLVLPAGIGSQVRSPSFTLPRGQAGWLQEWGMYVLAPDATTNAQWKILVNGGPVPGFDNLLNSPGILRLFLDGDDDMEVRLPTGAKIEMLITNLAASGPWTVGALLAGWYHPLATEEALWGLSGY